LRINLLNEYRRVGTFVGKIVAGVELPTYRSNSGSSLR